MLDGQFSANNNQNGTPQQASNGIIGGGAIPGGPGPGISVIVAPTGLAPEQNSWINRETPAKEGKKIQISDNMTTLDRVVLCASELCGTAILVFLGCVGCIQFGDSPPPLLQVAFTFGLAVMLAVQVFGHISGSHINPLVTVAAATMGTIPLIQVPIYFVGQMLGALGGFGLLKLATPEKILLKGNGTVGVCSPQLNGEISTAQGLLIEFTISLILTLVCCGVWDIRNKDKHDSVPLRFGLSITVLALAAAPYTGANMNPARSFAPALINGDWTDQWVYWVGPLAAAFTGSLFYKVLFNKDTSQDEDENTADVIPLNDNKA